MELEKAKLLATKLMKKHGLREKGWVFVFDSAKKRYGQCMYFKKIISLSAPLTELRERQHVKNTLLHEIAHALVGPGHGHDMKWKEMAIKIGCNGNRCSNDVKLPGKWIGYCPNGHISYRHRQPKLRVSCGVCLPKVFKEEFLIVYQPRP